MSQDDQTPSDVDEDSNDKPPKRPRYYIASCPGASSSTANTEETCRDPVCKCMRQTTGAPQMMVAVSGRTLEYVIPPNTTPQMKVSVAGRSLDYDVPLESFTMQNSDELADVLFNADVADRPSIENRMLRWQARQMAKGFVDNTINKVLEKWRLSAPSTNNFPERNSSCDDIVEDEGILMAIESHGLKQESTDQHNSFSDSEVTTTAAGGNQENGGGAEDAVEDNVVDDKNLLGEEADTEKIDDTDFLNAAVSVAISSKGLSSGSYE